MKSRNKMRSLYKTNNKDKNHDQCRVLLYNYAPIPRAVGI